MNNYNNPIFMSLLNTLANAANNPQFYLNPLPNYAEHLDHFKQHYFSEATQQQHYSYLSVLDRFKKIYGEYPTPRELYLSCKQPCGLLCPYYVTDDEYVQAADFFVKKTGEFLGNISCDRFYYFAQFYTIEHRDPSSVEEFLSFYRRNIIAQLNPESLFENDVIVRPVDREKLGAIQNTESSYEQKSDENEVCGICQEEFQKGHKYVKLECGHMFHSEEDKCCETGTIFKWFETHRMCPICRKEMV
jgi:hypothetical protein